MRHTQSKPHEEVSVSRWLSLLGALCIVGCEEPPPETLSGCDALSSPTAVEDCRYRLIEPALSDAAALHKALREVSDDTSRDLLLLRLAVNHPDQASLLCRQVTTPPAQQKCKQVLGRPHLSTKPR
jgi:hypothetical protein